MAAPGTLPAYRWNLAGPPPPSLARGLSHFDPVLVAALGCLGFRHPEEAMAFLECDPGPTDPAGLAGMAEAVDRLGRAVHGREPIVVYGDFDADGVTATAVLIETLRWLGADVRGHIPDRHGDGYGLHEDALLQLAREGARLVVTVDCGIRAASSVLWASAHGMDVIVTDHHALPDTLPKATAVIHPGRPGGSYSHKDLAGVGLAYKLSQALLRQVGPCLPPAVPAAVPVDEESLLDLVALGTVGDVVPLVGENRSLVARGLERMRTSPRPGVSAIAEMAHLDLGQVKARDIAYVLAPRLNAAGRMGSAEPALQVLLTRDRAEARELARQLEQANEDRRAATDAAVAAAEADLAGRTGEPFLFHVDPDVELGVTGLVAGRLCTAHYRPAAVLRLDGEFARGSARSIPEFDLMTALDASSGHLLRHGGHARAAGFTVARDQLAALQAELSRLAASLLGHLDLRPHLNLVTEVGPHQLSGRLLQELSRLEPHGEANPRPLLCVRGAAVSGARVVGTGHLRLELDDTPQGTMDAIAFGRGGSLSQVTRRMDLAATLRTNTWGGCSRLELRVEDLAPA